MIDQDVVEAIAALPCWRSPIDIQVLAGGMTNRNYRVRERAGRDFVVRFGADLPIHGVMRFNELAAARAAHAVGIAPAVVHAGAGVMVTELVEGEPLTPARMAEPAVLARVAALLRTMHTQMPARLQGPALIFWVFHVIRGYLGWLEQHAAMPAGFMSTDLRERCQRLEAALGPVRIVYTHNDLLAGNFIDDGERLWLIDWEYAGYNTPLFDLANLATNNALPVAGQHLLLELYGADRADAQLLRGFAAMQCASLLREALWGAVSRRLSPIDFDYEQYARAHLQRFEACWRESRHWLDGADGAR